MIKKLSFALIFIIINLLNNNNLYSQWDSIVFNGYGTNYSPTTYFRSVDVGFIFLDEGNYFKTTNSGLNWNKMFLDDSAIHIVDANFSDSLHGWVIDEFHYFYTNDGGATFTKHDLNQALYPLDIFVNDSLGFAITEYQKFKTTDARKNWKRDELLPSGYFYSYLNFFDKNNGIVCGFYMNNVYSKSGIFLEKTTDGGLNWNRDSLYNYTYNYEEKFCFLNPNLGWATGSSDGLVMKTTNGGTSWETIDTKMSGYAFKKIKFIDSTHGFILTNSDILSTSDGGYTWKNENVVRDKGYSKINFNKISSNHYRIYVSAKTDGQISKIYFKDLYIDSTDNIEQTFRKESFSLSPNPASEFINISYSNEIPIDNISIYNSLGFEIKRIEDYDFSGNNKINISTEEFPSGLYYFTIATRKEKFTKSFVVIK